MADGNDTSKPICTCHGKTDTTDVKHSGATNRIPRCWKVHRRELAPLPEFANYALSGMSRCQMPSRVSDMPEPCSAQDKLQLGIPHQLLRVQSQRQTRNWLALTSKKTTFVIMFWMLLNEFGTIKTDLIIVVSIVEGWHTNYCTSQSFGLHHPKCIYCGHSRVGWRPLEINRSLPTSCFPPPQKPMEKAIKSSQQQEFQTVWDTHDEEANPWSTNVRLVSNMQNTQLQKTELLNRLQRFPISTYLLANKKALGHKKMLSQNIYFLFFEK